MADPNTVLEIAARGASRAGGAFGWCCNSGGRICDRGGPPIGERQVGGAHDPAGVGIGRVTEQTKYREC